MAGGLIPGFVNDTLAPQVIDPGTMALTETLRPGVIGLDTGNTQAKGTPGSVASKIVAAATALTGQKIGDGQCFAYADRVLRAAGAKSAADFKPVVLDDDYVWGTQTTTSDVKPGDIIQFRDFLVKFTAVETLPDGSTINSDNAPGELRDHHTAIVESIDANNMVTVLEQNLPKGSGVHRSKIPLTDLSFTSGRKQTDWVVSGQIWIFHPVPK